MKTLIIIALGILLLINISNTESAATIPMKMQKIFSELYAGAMNENWELLENTYVVNFFKEEGSHYSIFSKDGEWIETGTEIQAVNMNQTVWINFVNSEYGTFVVSNIFIISTPDTPDYYKIVVMNDGEEIAICYDMDGKFIGKY